MRGEQLRPAAMAFDSIAPVFDARFGPWQSVAVQRRAVRRVLRESLPPGGHILEIGGGTGEDALWLANQGFRVTLTDISPAMVDLARGKLAPLGASAEIAAAEELDLFADAHFAGGGGKFDGVFSNFAPLNCVDDLAPVGRALARLVRPGGDAILVLFGTLSPGEMLVECLRGRPRQALRRLNLHPVSARLGGRHFHVTYHRATALRHAMQPWFDFSRSHGIGIFVPPSAAEPWISQHPRLLSMLERLDRFGGRALAALGDHVLYHFTRNEKSAP